MNLFINSKPIVGFDDRLLVLGGIVINTIVFMAIFYKGAIFNAPFDVFTYKWLEYFVFVSFMWILIRRMYFWLVKKLPGQKNTTVRWALLPFFVIPFFFIIIIYLNYIQPTYINLRIPGYPKPEQRNLLITGTLVLLVDTTIYTIITNLYQLNKIRIEKEILLREKAVNELNTLKNQLSPHFLFNSLNTLLYLIDEDTETSKDFIYKLSFLYQKLLQYANKDFITVTEELEYLKAYTDLLEKRHGGKLLIDLQIDQAIGQLFLVPLCTQMAVENAIKHNTITKAHPLTITITNEPYYIVITNELQCKFAADDSLGIGLQNLQKRYELLSNREVFYQKTENLFVLKIPLLDAWELKLKER